MDIEKELEPLQYIRETEPSPFLLARVKQRIAGINEAPPLWKWGIAATLALLIVMNGITLFHKAETQRKAAINIAAAMRLFPNNQLYHDQD